MMHQKYIFSWSNPGICRANMRQFIGLHFVILLNLFAERMPSLTLETEDPLLNLLRLFSVPHSGQESPDQRNINTNGIKTKNPLLHLTFAISSHHCPSAPESAVVGLPVHLRDHPCQCWPSYAPTPASRAPSVAWR